MFILFKLIFFLIKQKIKKINGFIKKHWQNKNDTTGRKILMKITIFKRKKSFTRNRNMT